MSPEPPGRTVDEVEACQCLHDWDGGGKVLTVNEHFLDVIMVHFLDGQLHSEPRALKVTSLICFNSLWTIKLRVVCLAEPEVEVII